MKMKQLKMMALAIGSCLAITSCSSEYSGNSMDRTFSNCFIRTTDGTESSEFISTSVECRVFFDLDNDVADVTISNFQPSASSSKGSIAVSGLPWSVASDGSMVISQEAVTSSSSSVTDFKMTYLNRYISNSNTGSYTSAPVISISFTYNNKYYVTLYQEQYLYLDNSTTVTTIADGSTFSPEPNTQYILTLNPSDMTATLYISGAQFAQQMPSIQMTFKKIPFSFVVDGFLLQSDSLIPESSDTPYPQYTITSLYGNANTTGSLNLGYTVADTWRVNTLLKYMSASSSN